jgi:ABC-type uncharacterized transport system YnjBCD permease subunit
MYSFRTSGVKYIFSFFNHFDKPDPVSKVISKNFTMGFSVTFISKEFSFFKIEILEKKPVWKSDSIILSLTYGEKSWPILNGNIYKRELSEAVLRPIKLILLIGLALTCVVKNKKRRTEI